MAIWVVEFWINSEMSKMPKFAFERQFTMSSFSIFFSLKNTNLGAHFLKNNFITKMMPNF